MKKIIKKYTTPQQRTLLRNKLKRLIAFFHSNDLNKLAQIYESDKWGDHEYTQHYEDHFKKFSNRKATVLEIGVGGYETSYIGGNSLRMWRDYFPYSKIVALDIFDKSPLNENRIKIYQGSQDDEKLLKLINSESGPFDIIIDDGSHINEHVIKSFEILFPLLNYNGIYAIEDTLTSYHSNFGGSYLERDSTKTMMGYFKNLVHGLNYTEFPEDANRDSFWEKSISSIHFYKNLVIIHKSSSPIY